MKYVPRQYQWADAYYLRRRAGALCGLECGLGKTLVALLALKLLRDGGEITDQDKILIVCPPNLDMKAWWRQEIEDVLGLQVTLYEGMVNKKEKVYHNLDNVTGVVLAHYPHFRGKNRRTVNPLTKPLLKQRWSVVILDECHWVKNRAAQRTKMIKLLKTKYKWGLSGTLVAEFPHDLWSLLNWIDSGRWSSYWNFVAQYCNIEVAYNPNSGQEYRKVGGVKPMMLPDGTYSTDATLSVLRRNTENYITVKRREDVGVELPPVSTVNVPLVMSVEQGVYYNKVKKETIIHLVEKFGKPDVWDLRNEDSLVIKNAAVRFIRLIQISSAPDVFFATNDNAKKEWLLDYLDGGGRPAVIFTRFRHTKAVIENLLADLGKTGFIVGTYDKMSEGLNLQHLDTLIAWDPSPSRMKWEQARYRIHRVGQERPCFIYRLMCSDVDRRAWRQIDFKEITVQTIAAWLRKEISEL